MPDFFQTTRHRKSAYNRPESKWICGGECRDCPCFLGPDPKGKCQAGRVFDNRVSGQCLPRKAGGRWLCTRPDSHGGETCQRGPLPDGSCCMTVPPCRPKRSLRSRRGILAAAVSLATVVWLVAVLAPDPSGESDPMAGLDPGPLSASHSFLQGQCFRCHANQEIVLSPSSIAGLHGDAARHRGIDDGKLCLSCHDTIGGTDGAFAFSPHTTGDLPQANDSRKSGKLIDLAASRLSGRYLGGSEIQCATCHQEHHGEEFKIATLSDRQCQTCHQDQFESFSKGHPDFTRTGYPYKRRTAIRFDHASHYQTHFKEELKADPNYVPTGFDPTNPHAESLSCTSCHDTGSSGEIMTVKPFETSCASCHEEKDTREGSPLAFLAFPPLNKAALDERLAVIDPPRSLGTWIEETPNTFPWPTLQMLRQDAREAWTRLRAAGIDPFDPEAQVPDNPDVTADIESIAWAVKELARDLSQNQPSENESNRIGHAELVGRLREAGFSDPDSLVKGFPPGAFDAMRQGFAKDDYIRLLAEVNAKRSGTFPAPPSPTPAPGESVVTPMPESPENAAEETFGEPAEESFGEPTEESFGEPTEESFGEPAEESFGNDSEESFGGDEEFGPEPAKDAEPTEPEATELEAIDPINWAARGGWYQHQGAVYYRSTGHADPIIKNWLDELARRVDSPLALAQLKDKDGFGFQEGAESKSSGKCLKCHSVDEVRDQNQRLTGARIQWKSLADEGSRSSLARYNHATHMLLADCRSCHQTQSESTGFLSSFPKGLDDWDAAADWSAKADPSKFHSNFQAIKKQTCAACHQPGKAGDSCIQCHSYHKPHAPK